MSNKNYLKRLFQAYYSEKEKEIPIVNSFEHREFGFIPWDKQIMIRHISFETLNDLKHYIIENGPRHVYFSGAHYLLPEVPEMSKKKYQGCDFIIDIDVDHFYTPCKEEHDIWYCNECKNSGKGMVKKCPKCKGVKFKTLNWICEKCLEIAKTEIQKLIYNFLIPDFNIDEDQMKIAFSGHRGYHLKIGDKRIRTLTSEERREVADYLSGENISFDILGLNEKGNVIFGLKKKNIGWSQKIIEKIEEILKTYSNQQIQNLMLKNEFSKNLIKSFLNYKKEFLTTISDEQGNKIWSIEGFGINTWRKFLNIIAREIGAELDEPVTIDIHRLIRYPGSLHGATGFKVQELTLKELEGFIPLNESNKKLDPIVFQSNNLQKLVITEREVPIIKIKDESYGPYSQSDHIEVPLHVAIFLLSKEVARTL